MVWFCAPACGATTPPRLNLKVNYTCVLFFLSLSRLHFKRASRVRCWFFRFQRRVAMINVSPRGTCLSLVPSSCANNHECRKELLLCSPSSARPCHTVRIYFYFRFPFSLHPQLGGCDRSKRRMRRDSNCADVSVSVPDVLARPNHDRTTAINRGLAEHT